jgi:hypothetical protein
MVFKAKQVSDLVSSLFILLVLAYLFLVLPFDRKKMKLDQYKNGKKAESYSLDFS